LLKEFHVNGWTDVRGRDKGALVGLEVEDRALNWSTLCQSLYVLMHEYVCHAFQGVCSTERCNADETCSWSDGWMDAFAWCLLERWLEGDHSSLPQWLQRDLVALKDHCQSLHLRRYQGGQGPSMTEVHLVRRVNARKAFYALERGMAGPRSRRLLASRRASAFSVQYNVAGVSRDQRDEICALLEAGLCQHGETQSVCTAAVAHACNAFVAHGDPGELASQLRLAVGLRPVLRSLLPQ
jgi:hypothetical protein